MQHVNVKFDNVKQVEQFVNMIEKFDAHFDLGCGHKVVNAKSILGVFALDLTKPLSLCYASGDAALIEKITPFLYKGEENPYEMDIAN